MNNLLEKVITLAKSTAKHIITIYQQQDYHITIKQDNSPVTIADQQAHNIIKQGLQQLTPNIPLISEEAKTLAYSTRSNWHKYWLIDPLDGTKEFIEHTDEFTVNIALIENHQPILGIVAAPATQEIYYAMRSEGAYWQLNNHNPKKITVKKNNDTLRITASRRHGNQQKFHAFLAQLSMPYTLITCGSALKLCLIAKGEADLYLRFGDTSEWDTAAGQCILETAGGSLLALTDNKPLQYNTKPSLINPEFAAIGKFDWLATIRNIIV